MGKSRNGKMTERQLRMLELKAEGKSYTDIGDLFEITGSGARENIRTAARLLQRHGEDAFPLGVQTAYSVDALIASVPSLRPLPIPKVPASPPKIEPKLVVPTPLGDIIVGVKADSTYPGIYIDLKGPKVNDEYSGTDGSAALATVEFDPGKGKIQSIIYGNGNSEEYTHLVEHENMAKEKKKPPLSQVIQNANARTGQQSKEKSIAIDLER